MAITKNLLFDLGNVLYDIDFAKMYTAFEQLGIPNFENHFTLNKSDQIFFDLFSLFKKGLALSETVFVVLPACYPTVRSRTRNSLSFFSTAVPRRIYSIKGKTFSNGFSRCFHR